MPHGAPGGPVAVNVRTILRFEDGCWQAQGTFGLLQQLGALPAAA